MTEQTQPQTLPTFARSQAMLLASVVDDLLIDNDLTVPNADEDEQRQRLEDGSELGLYGTEYFELEDRFNDIIDNKEAMGAYAKDKVVVYVVFTTSDTVVEKVFFKEADALKCAKAVYEDLFNAHPDNYESDAFDTFYDGHEYYTGNGNVGIAKKEVA
jgi:hypothetical protein